MNPNKTTGTAPVFARANHWPAMPSSYRRHCDGHPVKKPQAPRLDRRRPLGCDNT